MKKLLTDPMLRYLVVGGLLFAAFGDILDDERETIALSEGYVAGLTALEAERLGRAPTEAEIARVIDRHVEDEALYREAVAMGLDDGDVIVRRRLVQKMRFLLDDALVTAPPTEAELAEQLAADPAKFARPASFDFEHRFFARDGEADRIDVAKAQLAAGEEAPSDPFLLTGRSVSGMSSDEIRRTFGGDLAEGLADAPLDAWFGPVTSRYGLHLVRVSARTETRAPSLDDPEVRRRVAEHTAKVKHRADVRAAVAAIVASYPTDRPEPKPETIAQVTP